MRGARTARLMAVDEGRKILRDHAARAAAGEKCECGHLIHFGFCFATNGYSTRPCPCLRNSTGIVRPAKETP